MNAQETAELLARELVESCATHAYSQIMDRLPLVELLNVAEAAEVVARYSTSKNLHDSLTALRAKLPKGAL